MLIKYLSIFLYNASMTEGPELLPTAFVAPIFQYLNHQDDTLLEWQFRLLKRIVEQKSLAFVYQLLEDPSVLLDLLFNHFSEIIEKRRFPSVVKDCLPTL